MRSKHILKVISKTLKSNVLGTSREEPGTGVMQCYVLSLAAAFLIS